MLNQEKKSYVVGYKRHINSNNPSWKQFSHLHKEADTLLLCVVREITLLSPQSSIFIKIVSLDTDVVVLCFHLLSTLQHLSGLDMVFELYIKDRQLVSVNKCIAGLGEQKARALLGLHVFSGCDQVEKMATVSKARVMKWFLLPLTTHALCSLESFCNLSLSTEGEQFNTGLSEFTMQLYLSHHDSSVSDIDALRWFLFSKQNYTGYRLPPTWGALKYHIFAHTSLLVCGT